MARVLRFQYPGAIYHLMARGDGSKTVFENKDDCEVFLHRLREACGSCGWRVHRQVPTNKHLTPEPSLSISQIFIRGR